MLVGVGLPVLAPLWSAKMLLKMVRIVNTCISFQITKIMFKQGTLITPWPLALSFKLIMYLDRYNYQCSIEFKTKLFFLKTELAIVLSFTIHTRVCASIQRHTYRDMQVIYNNILLLFPSNSNNIGLSETCLYKGKKIKNHSVSL